MIVVVTGGRAYGNRRRLYAVLDGLHAAYPVAKLGHGAAYGADVLAAHWCRERGVPCRAFQAAWETLGRAAGHARNGEMLALMRPDLVVAFPGSYGTKDCVRQAEGMGIFVFEVDQPWP